MSMLHLSLQYRRALSHYSPPHITPLHLQNKQRSFLAFGFGAGSSGAGPVGAGGVGGGGVVPPSPVAMGNNSVKQPGRRDSHININVAPTSHDMSDTPEIRKYKKRFSSEILCASLWGE